MGGRLLGIARLLCGASALWPAAVHAQSPECGGFEGAPSSLHVMPRDRAEQVALDALIQVRFPEDTDLAELQRTVAAAGGTDVCGGEVLCLFRDDSGSGGSARRPEPGQVAHLDARTFGLLPDSTLRPDSDYFVSIARPGFARASRTETEFTTGGARDSLTPGLVSQVSELRLMIDAPPPECRAEPGSVRVRVLVPRISDDADETSVEALLFLTRAEALRGPTLRARAHNPEAGDVLLGFVLAPEEAESPVCVALRALDGAGRASESAPELCFDPRQGSHFVSGCRAVPAGGGPAHGARTLVFSMAVLLAVRLGLRRRRASGGHSVGAHA